MSEFVDKYEKVHRHFKAALGAHEPDGDKNTADVVAYRSIVKRFRLATLCHQGNWRLHWDPLEVLDSAILDMRSIGVLDHFGDITPPKWYGKKNLQKRLHQWHYRYMQKLAEAMLKAADGDAYDIKMWPTAVGLLMYVTNGSDELLNQEERASFKRVKEAGHLRNDGPPANWNEEGGIGFVLDLLLAGGTLSVHMKDGDPVYNAIKTE
jgi:hypothetical protein